MQHNLSKRINPIQRIFFCCLLFLIAFFSWVPISFSQSAENEPFILSQRVGAELDSNEIEYFNIFPQLDDVKSAVYRKDNFENVRMLASLANGKDTTITFSKLAAEQLKLLIDHFESLPDSSKLVDWKLLPGYTQSRFNYYESSGRKVVVTTSEGKFRGRLLMATDSALCIWMKKDDFSPADFQRFIKVIDPKTIVSIEVKSNLSSKLFGASLGAGLAIGALQLGFNVTDASDYVLSSNSILLLGIGAAVGSLGGFFFDGITTRSRTRKVNQDIERYRKVKDVIAPRSMFYQVYPPELKNLR